MNTASTSSPAWNRLHHSLLEERSRVQSAEVIQLVNRSLLAGENVSAAFYDLSQLKLLQLRKTLPLLTPQAEAEIAAFLTRIAAVLPEVVCDDAQFAALQREVALLDAQFNWQHASLLLVQNALFNLTYGHWQQMLETLFREEDSQATFVQLQQVLVDSCRKMPVLGETHDLYQVLTMLLENCREKAVKYADAPGRLAEFIAAADIATRGIVIFDATAKAVLRGRPLPSQSQLDALIKAHHHQVIERTHPWFTAV